MRITEIARALIDIESVTGNEAQVAEWLESYAYAQGYSVERNYVSEDRWNVFINWDERTEVVFSTHIDVVPPHITSSVKENRIYGRGACDTKGIIAAMLIAGEELHLEGHKPSYLFLVGEEVDSIGAKIASKSDKTARYVITGEPTNNSLVSGHKGVLGYTVSVSGKAAHSAFPDLGHSAIELLLDIVQDIRVYDWGTSELLGESTINIGKISGGLAMNVVPDAATVTVLHRVVSSTSEVQKEVEGLIAGRGAIEYHARSEPQQMYVPDGYSSKVVPFGTDIPHLHSMGTPLLVGPGDIHQAHTAHEHISIQEMEEAVFLYKQLYKTLTTK
jgi:acetylornithine deacetylase/succinyl-diaminopimelate desuccinylase-like protein